MRARSASRAGAWKPGDSDDPVATALREAAEEVGLDPTACGLAVLGHLEPLWIPPSNFLVTPVVAIAAHEPALSADPREVAAILHSPVTTFLPGANRAPWSVTSGAGGLRYGAFPMEGRMVWGATAKMLAQLGALLGHS